MATRMLEGESWLRLVERVRSHGAPLTVAWAALTSSEGPETGVVALTIRGAEAGDPVHYLYERLEISRAARDPAAVAHQLEAGQIEPGRVEFSTPDPSLRGTAYWVGRSEPFGMTAPMSRPSYYYSHPIFGSPYYSSPPSQRARLDAPLSGRGQPYWPRASDALLEVVFGVTRHQPRQDISQPGLIVQLPYRGPHIASIDWVDNEGLVITLGDSMPASGPEFELHVVWSLNTAEPHLRRDATSVHANVVTARMGAAPLWYSVGLVDPVGLLVDSAEGSFAVEQPSFSHVPLPGEALLEAFDFLASVWRNAFASNLFGAQRQLASIGSLALPVATRSDFESRLSQLDALLKSVVISDDLLVDPNDVDVQGQKTLNRLDSVFAARFGRASAEYAGATRALGPLRKLNALRVAIQHSSAAPDLPTTLAALGLVFPADWPRDWEQLKRVVRSSLVDLRAILEASLPR